MFDGRGMHDRRGLGRYDVGPDVFTCAMYMILAISWSLGGC